MRALALQIAVAFLVAIIVVFVGMFLPFPSDGALHNPIWEFIFGIGFGIAELFPRAIDMRVDALLGFLLWPLFIFATVWFAAFHMVRASRRTRLIAGSLFILSLLICVGRDTQNSIAVHVPLWSNEYAVRY